MEKNLEKILGTFYSGIKCFAGSRFARIVALATLPSIVFCCANDPIDAHDKDYCANHGYSAGIGEIILTPNPTRGVSEVLIEADVSSQGSGIITGGKYKIGDLTGKMSAKDGSFDSQDETLVATVNVDELDLGYGERAPVSIVGVKTSRGCAETLFLKISGTHHSFLNKTSENMLATEDWQLLNNALIRYGSGGFIDLSWEGAQVSAVYDFVGGPTEFAISALTKCGMGPPPGESCPTGDCCGRGALSLFIDDALIGSFYVDEKIKDDFIVDGWYDYYLNANIPAGQHSIAIVYSNDEWNRDVYLDKLEIIE